MGENWSFDIDLDDLIRAFILPIKGFGCFGLGDFCAAPSGGRASACESDDPARSETDEDDAPDYHLDDHTEKVI
jgi:hypothetical protein